MDCSGVLQVYIFFSLQRYHASLYREIVLLRALSYTDIMPNGDTVDAIR